jgi:CRP-like cAMP-binding protein
MHFHGRSINLLEKRTMKKILMLGEKTVFLNGVTMFSKGQPSDTIFYIKNGFVQLIADETPRVVVKKDHFLGLSDALADRPYSNEAVVFNYAEVIRIDAVKLRALSIKDSEVQSYILKKMSEDPILYTHSFE